MNGIQLTDTQIAAGLARVSPPAPSDLRSAVLAEIEHTSQERAYPSIVGWLTNADPIARRRSLILATAALALLAAMLAVAAGAILKSRPVTPVPLAFDIVQSAYSRMPELKPLVLTTLEDGSKKERIEVGANGAIRIEEFASVDATAPSGYRILAGTELGQLFELDGKPYWYQQAGAISEDPRVFVYAEISPAAFPTGPNSRCLGATDPLQSGSQPGGWTYVGLEQVVGRPAYHVRCAGDLWIDVETGLVLRSSGPAVGRDGLPIAGKVHTIEVASLTFAEPSAALFDIAAPAGVAVATDDQHSLGDCIRFALCLASPRPIVTPPPAVAASPAITADALVARTAAVSTALPAYELVLQSSNTGLTLVGDRTRVLFDGANRYRIEVTNQPGTVWETTSTIFTGPAYKYRSEIQPDGSTIWRDASSGGFGSSYPLRNFPDCPGGWRYLATATVADRVADHLGCPSSQDGTEIWIDRLLPIELRSQVADPTSGGTNVQEVVSLQFGPLPASLFDLPPELQHPAPSQLP